MRVAIVGSHGTGKSSIINNLEVRGYDVVKEVARDVMGYVGKNPQDMNQHELVAFQTEIYYSQNRAENSQINFIADRGIYDNLAYAYFVSEDLYKTLMTKAQTHPGYDKVFYTPIEFPLEKDGVRFEDTRFQKQIDEKILEILDTFNIQYEELTGSIDERVQKVLNYIQSKGTTT